MSFLSDYLLYNSGNECPKNYHIWSALALLSSIVSHKVLIESGYYITRPNLYVCLVGEQGSRKSAAKDIARDILKDEFPGVPMSYAVMSKEAITKFLGSSDSVRAYTDWKGILTEYHPFSMFINELKNFIGINPTGMIDFLTDIYDRKVFDVGTKNKGDDLVPNPYLVLLACETPEWIVSKLKADIISGGFSRRVIFVYETDEVIRIPFPTITPEMANSRARFITRLHQIEKITGVFVWSNEARSFYDQWYQTLVYPTDPIMRGYFRSKHIQLLKVTMLLSLADRLSLVIERETLEVALALLDSIEPNMAKLSCGVGRNELAQPTNKLLEYIQMSGEIVSEKDLLRFCYRDMSPQEVFSVLQHLEKTEQIVKFKKIDKKTGVERIMIGTKEKYLKLTAKVETVLHDSSPSSQFLTPHP